MCALREHGYRDGSPREDLRWVAGLTRRALDAEASALTVLDVGWQHFLSYATSEPSDEPVLGTPTAHSLCRFVVEREAPLVVHDALEHWLLADHPAVVELGVRTYAGVPFRAPGGHVLGGLCVFGRHERRWTADNLADLERIALLLCHELERT